MQNDKLAGALKSIAVGLLEGQNQDVNEICLGIEFFEIFEMQEGVDVMTLKLASHGDAKKLYKQWKLK
jgi:hypothetical protein